VGTVTNAKSYLLQYADTANFLLLIRTHTGNLVPGVNSYEVTDPNMLRDGLWYWRVATVNATDEVGSYSTALSFTIDTTPPASPTLTAPLNGATPVGIPAFIWSIPTGANAYQFQLDDDSAFGSPLITTPDGSSSFPGTPLALYTFTPSGLTLGTVYYWHVKARDAAGNWSDWSSAFSMNPQAVLPTAPLLTSPINALFQIIAHP
jgi:hypothetical protein